MKPILRRIAHWRTLQREERAIWIEAALLLCLTRAALWIVPFKFLHRGIARQDLSPPLAPEEATGHCRVYCAQAVRRLARFVPRATCLTQSLVVLMMLRRRKDPVILQIGVAKGEDGKLRAHAWVETRERLNLTASGEGFTPLLHL